MNYLNQLYKKILKILLIVIVCSYFSYAEWFPSDILLTTTNPPNVPMEGGGFAAVLPEAQQQIIRPPQNANFVAEGGVILPSENAVTPNPNLQQAGMVIVDQPGRFVDLPPVQAFVPNQMFYHDEL